MELLLHPDKNSRLCESLANKLIQLKVPKLCFACQVLANRNAEAAADEW